MDVHRVEIVRKRQIPVATLVRTGIEHHATLWRYDLRDAAHLLRRLVHDGRGQVLESNRLTRDLPFGDFAAGRDGKQRGERRIGLAVGVVDLRLEADAPSRSLHRLAPDGQRLAALAAVSRRMDPLRSQPVRGPARPRAHDQFLAERLEGAFPCTNGKRHLPTPVARHAVRLAPVANTVQPIVVPEADDDTCQFQQITRFLGRAVCPQMATMHLGRAVCPQTAAARWDNAPYQFQNRLFKERRRREIARAQRALLP